MKRNFSIVMLVIVLVAILSVAPAWATQSFSLGDSLDLPGFSFSYNTSVDKFGMTSFDTKIANCDRIISANISIQRDIEGPGGWVMASFCGDFVQATKTDPLSQFISINRHGVSVSSNVGICSYQESISGDWLSYGYASASLTGVKVLFSEAYYRERGDNDENNPNFVDGSSWYTNVEWRIKFIDSITATYASALGAVQVETSPGADNIPEPASLGFFSFGIFGLLMRRRQIPF